MKSKKGISLIVLVITIIVMIILASAIIMSLDNDNIFNKAEEAVDKTNNKALEQQASLYEIDLKLEFSELGLGNVILSKDARQAYMDAIKAGKTEEEARQIAKDTLVGSYYDWIIQPNDKIQLWFSKSVNCTPMYEEVKRVINILHNSSDEEELKSVTIDETVVPEDLVNNLKEYKQMVIDLIINETLDDDTFNSRYESMEPLYGLLEKDPNNKYFYEMAKVKLPYYIYKDPSKKEIVTRNGYRFDYYFASEISPRLDEITTLIVDENYTVLNNWAIPEINENAKIILPNTLKVIKKGAFRECVTKSIEIPSSVEKIEEKAFNYKLVFDSKITELVIRKEEGSIPGAPWGLDTTKTTIIWQPE